MAYVENKVTGAVVGASGSVVVANFVLWVLAHYYSADAATAQPVVAFVNLVVAGGGAFVVGYLSRHTPRTFDNGEVVPQGDLDPPGNAL